MPEASSGALSLVPVVLALLLAFWTKNAAFSLLVGCVVGGVLAGFDPATVVSMLPESSKTISTLGREFVASPS